MEPITEAKLQEWKDWAHQEGFKKGLSCGKTQRRNEIHALPWWDRLFRNF